MFFFQFFFNKMTDKIKIPPIVFKIIWPILYILLLLFIIFTYRQPRTKIRTILIYSFWIGILLNILWIILYWKLENKLFAFIDLILMVLISFYILYLSFPDKSSNKKSIFNFFIYLLYTSWISFALFLTIYNKNYK